MVYAIRCYINHFVLSESIACSANLQASLRAHIAGLSPPRVESKLPIQERFLMSFIAHDLEFVSNSSN